MAIKSLRVFLSSPGDVGLERLLAVRVLERLQGEFAAAITIEPILWEDVPLRNGALPGADRPSVPDRHRRCNPLVAAGHAFATGQVSA